MPEADGSYRCLPAYELPPPEQQQGSVGEKEAHEKEEACNALSTVRGYLLVSHGSRMSVFNTTEDTRLVFTKDKATPAVAEVGNEMKSEGCGEGGVALAPRWSVVSSHASGEAFVVEAKSCAAVSSPLLSACTW